MATAATFVLAAQIAAELHFATKVAEKLSLTAKNAHAVSARAGQQASGFRAITSYIEELAVNTINQASQISHNAIVIATMAANRERLVQAFRHFERVSSSSGEIAHLSSIAGPMQQTREKLNALEKEFGSFLLQLELQLEDTLQQIRAAGIISSTSKVEASLAGSFKSQLEVIAENIATSAESIKKHLQTSQKLLTEAAWSLRGPGKRR